MLGTMRLTLLSVNVGQPSQIGERAGAPVISAIRKAPVATDTINILAETLEGDRVADLTVHGGVSKAIYAYPKDNWDWWTNEVGLSCRAGAFGENLTLEGATEHDIQVGDRFSWGEAVLEVSQPRAPCYKFQIYTGKADAAARMTVSGRCGWYYRVVTPGAAPTSGTLERIQTGTGASVFDTFMAAFNRRYPADTRAQIAAAPALAPEWRDMLVARA